MTIPGVTYRFGKFTLQTADRRLMSEGCEIYLRPKTYDTLLYLLDRHGHLVTKKELLDAVWADVEVTENALTHCIKEARSALVDNVQNPEFLRTIPRLGYEFVGDVETASEAANEEFVEEEFQTVHLITTEEDTDAEASAPGSPVALPAPSVTERQLTRGKVAVAAMALLALSVGAYGIWRSHNLEVSARGAVAEVLSWVGYRSTPAAIVLESLAVLPMKNFSGDPSKEFFADGMTDALIAGLAQVSTVKVVSRTSVMHYKGTSQTAPQIARELGVEGIVETSLMLSGNRMRVTAQLIDARQDRHLWVRSYEREITDVLGLQSELVQAIADGIRVQISSEELARLTTSRRVDREVLEDTFKGRALLDYPTREDQFRQAADLFQTAADRDPTYAPAWAGLSEALWSMAAWGFEFVDPAEVRGRAIAAADRALALDDNLPEAHMARAIVAVDGEWDLAAAQEHFEKALELRPGYVEAHTWYGHILGGQPLQRFDEARQHLDRARELDPLSPWNDITLLSWWLFQGRPQQALAVGEHAYQRHPTLWVMPWQTGFAQLALEQPQKAIPLFEAALKILQPERPAVVLAPLGLAYGLAGRRADALKILNEMQRAAKQHYISPVYLAVVRFGVGQKDEAFRLLDWALEQRTPWLLICVPDDPLTRALQRDPRWKPFISRLRREVRLPRGAPNPYF